MADQKRKLQVIRDSTKWGVCLWEVDGEYFSNENQEYLSMEGYIGDEEVEKKMRRSAYHWLGHKNGQPVWIPGYRKVSQMEWEDQMARLLEGKTPDEIEVVRSILERGYGSS